MFLGLQTTTETYECWQLALENLKTPSVLALTRQNLDPIRKEFIKKNKCSLWVLMKYLDQIKI